MTSLFRLEVSWPCRARRSRTTTSVVEARRAATASPTTPAPITATPVSAMRASYIGAPRPPMAAAGLDAEDGDAHRTRPRPVELDQEHALPAAEARPPVRHGQGLRGPQEEGLAMGMAVDGLVGSNGRPAREVVVAVGPPARGRPLEGLAQVLHQQRLVLVDDDGGRGVER